MNRNRSLPDTRSPAMVGALCLLGASLAPTSARADDRFAPIRCSATGQSQAYQWRVGLDASSDVPFDPVDALVASRRYDNQQRHTRTLLTNRYVNSVGLVFSRFDTEANYDTLAVSLATPRATLSGALGATTYTFRPLLGSFQGIPLQMVFTSDGSVTRPGFDLSSLVVGCSGAVDDSINTFDYTTGRVDGVLLGYNDVVYTSYRVDDPSAHYTLSMWSPSVGGGQDFDVYMACGRRPTATDYDIRANASPTAGSNSEFIHLDPSARPCASTWQVAVLSYGAGGATGQGYFHMLWQKHRPDQHVRYSVGVQSPGAADLASAQSFLTASSRKIFGATSGQVLLTYDLYNLASPDQTNCDSPTWRCGGAQCSVCLRGPTTRGQGAGARLLSDRIDTTWDIWHGGSGSLAHEFGHAHLGLEDNYVGLPDTNVGVPADWPGRRCISSSDCGGTYGFCWGVDLLHGIAGYCFNGSYANVCGHSMMANGYLSNEYCTSYDHLRDARYVGNGFETWVLTRAGDPTTAYSTPISYAPFANSYAPVLHSTRWTDRSDYQVALANRVFLWEPAGSPDPYRFADFNAPAFGAWVGNVAWHP